MIWDSGGLVLEWWLFTLFLASPAVVLLTLPVFWLGRNWVTSLAWTAFGLNGLLFMVTVGIELSRSLRPVVWTASVIFLLGGWFLRPRAAKRNGSAPSG